MNYQKFNWIIVNSNPHKEIKSGDKINFRNVSVDKFLCYGEQESGAVNLSWQNDPSHNVLIQGQNPSLKISSETVVALKIDKANKYLIYKEREDGINLGWSDVPVYEWKIESAIGGLIDNVMSVALFNITAKNYVIYHSRDEGVNLCWLSQTPPANSKIDIKKEAIFKSNNNFLVKEKSPIYSSGYNGMVQEFEGGNVYWHKVMKNEAHEVHGAILFKYKEMGACDINPANGIREFGFPISDEVITDDGLFPISYFEFGAIIWKGEAGAISICGDFYKEWQQKKWELGYPVTDRIKIGNGEAVYFQYGVLWKKLNANKFLMGKYSFHQMGNPLITVSNPNDLERHLTIKFYLENDQSSVEDLKNVSRLLIKDVFFAQQIDAKSNLVKLGGNFSFNEAQKLAEIGISNEGNQFSERKLYNLIIKLPNGNVQNVGPHSIYAKNSWKTFNIMHATDIHLSRRVESFLKTMTDKNMEAAKSNFNHFNNNFRILIKYANKLHKEGKLDCIMLTGDLVDYVFEDSDNRLAGGNFSFFERLILGKADSPEGVKNEELLVPIFTSLGNHDYRPNRYSIYAEYLGFDLPYQNKPFNLTLKECETLQGGEIISYYDGDKVSKMIDADEENRNGSLNYYFRNINSQPTYSVNLGKHRIVMVDSKWDIGIVDDLKDYACEWLKDGVIGDLFDMPDQTPQDHFLAGSPDSFGIKENECQLLDSVLRESEKEGIVIVGIHAPLLNPNGDRYHHYLRETLRGGPCDTISRLNKKFGFGTSKGSFYKFLELIAGNGSNSKKADLILSGHTHNNWECRIVNGADGINLFTDFYTENPESYYHSFVKNTNQKVHVAVVDEVKFLEPQRVNTTRDGHNVSYYVLETPTNKTALNDSVDAKKWWDNHKPLLLQTVGTGPIGAYQRIENNDGQISDPNPSFHGFRIIQVKEDVITKIHNVTLTDLNKNGLKMPWEKDFFIPNIVLLNH